MKKKEEAFLAPNSRVQLLIIPLEEMPPDCMKCILIYLCLCDLQSLSLSSSQLYHTSRDATHLFMSSHALMDQRRLQSILLKYKSLNVLHLHGLASVGDALFDVINHTVATTVREIYLSGCSISPHCQTTTLKLDNLTHLKISGGSLPINFGTLLSSNHQLQYFAIGPCFSLRDCDIGHLFCQRHSVLETLYLHQCYRLKAPKIQVPALRHLQLMGCVALEDLPDFDCPQLTSLNLTFCYRLEGVVIQKLIQSLGESLIHLSLVRGPLLTSLNIHSPTLQSCNVSLSNNLRDLALYCHSLQSLNTVACSSLEKVTIVSSAMEALNLSTLPRLRELDLHLPALVQLRLSGCQHLVDGHVHVHAPALQEVDIGGTRLSPRLFAHVPKLKSSRGGGG